MLRSTPISPVPLPMTSAAWSALHAEARRTDQGPSGRVDPTLTLRIDTIRDVLQSATVVDEPLLAVVGRRVTYLEDDGSRHTVALVIPGDGDPRQGWISADAPLGAALLGARPGQGVVVHAPVGDRRVEILEVR